MNQEEIAEYGKMRNSVLHFVERTWGLRPQPVRPEHAARYAIGLLMEGEAWQDFLASVRAEWFLPFRKSSMVTWQQALILHGIDKANRGTSPKKLSIVSGRGIGKTCTLSWVILWFLFVYPKSVVPCTAMTSDQLSTVLWPELARWLDAMPPGMRAMYDWSSEHVRMREAPSTWFARARTSSKDRPEALSGVHADNILAVADEASGIDEKVWEMGQGVLTSPNAILIMISNGTRSSGYFYRSHHGSRGQYQVFSFSTVDSPVADRKFVDSVVTEYCGTCETPADYLRVTEYRVNVAGLFPLEGVMDDDGYVQLFGERDLHMVPFDPDWDPAGRTITATDPSGDGQDTTEQAVRNRARAGIMFSEQTSNNADLAQKGVTLCDRYGVDPIDWVIDAFGVGHDIAMEVALLTSAEKRPWRVTPVNVGEECEDEDDRALYANRRAEMFFKLRAWSRNGGEIMESPGLRQELLSIQYKVVGKRYQIMNKVEMRKRGFRSPNKADAVAMTFLRPDRGEKSVFGDPKRERRTAGFDPHATME